MIDKSNDRDLKSLNRLGGVVRAEAIQNGRASSGRGGELEKFSLSFS